MTLRLDDEQERQLRAVADEEERPMHSVVVTAIAEYVARKKAQQFAELSDEIAERHAALLDRLAQ